METYFIIWLFGISMSRQDTASLGARETTCPQTATPYHTGNIESYLIIHLLDPLFQPVPWMTYLPTPLPTNSQCPVFNSAYKRRIDLHMHMALHIC